MADVFISYSMGDATEIARDIAKSLRENEISCWYAGEHQELGVYAEHIAAAIEDCRVFLLVMNESAIHSTHVKSETALAFRRLDNNEKITLVPFRVEDCSPRADKAMDYYLILQEIVDGRPPDTEHIQNLIDRIRRILNF